MGFCPVFEPLRVLPAGGEVHIAALLLLAGAGAGLQP